MNSERLLEVDYSQRKTFDFILYRNTKGANPLHLSRKPCGDVKFPLHNTIVWSLSGGISRAFSSPFPKG